MTISQQLTVMLLFISAAKHVAGFHLRKALSSYTTGAVRQ
jgi:hypothetical protein